MRSVLVMNDLNKLRDILSTRGISKKELSYLSSFNQVVFNNLNLQNIMIVKTVTINNYCSDLKSWKCMQYSFNWPVKRGV